MEEEGEADTQGIYSLKKAKSWARSSLFLCKLGCLTEDGELPPFPGQECEYAVNQEYTITGFYSGHEPGTHGIIQINGRETLSLEAEAIGRVLGMSFVGFSVMRMWSKPDAIVDLLIPEQRKTAMVRCLGYRIDSFRPGLKEYIQLKKEELWLPGQRGYIAGGFAYCLNEERLQNVKYNWADLKADHVRSYLRSLRRKDRMSSHVKSFLEAYINGALPLLRQAQAPGGVLTPESLPRRCTESMGRKRKPQVPEEVPFRRSKRHKVERKACASQASEEASGPEGRKLRPRRKHSPIDKQDYAAAAQDQHPQDMDTVLTQKLRLAEQESREMSHKCIEGLSAGIVEIAESGNWLRTLFRSKYNKLKADNKALRQELARLRDDSCRY